MNATAVLVVLTVAIVVLIMALIPPGRRARGRRRVRGEGA
jgi:hypothetical protein